MQPFAETSVQLGLALELVFARVFGIAPGFALGIVWGIALEFALLSELALAVLIQHPDETGSAAPLGSDSQQDALTPFVLQCVAVEPALQFGGPMRIVRPLSYSCFETLAYQHGVYWCLLTSNAKNKMPQHRLHQKSKFAKLLASKQTTGIHKHLRLADWV